MRRTPNANASQVRELRGDRFLYINPRATTQATFTPPPSPNPNQDHGQEPPSDDACSFIKAPPRRTPIWGYASVVCVQAGYGVQSGELKVVAHQDWSLSWWGEASEWEGGHEQK